MPVPNTNQPAASYQVLAKEVEVLQKLWESYTAMATFFANLVGATLATFVALPFIKDNPTILRSSAMIAGLTLMACALLVSIAWRWCCQWAMEMEIMGGVDGIDDFFSRAQRPRLITGAAQTGMQRRVEIGLTPVLRAFMKIAAGLILALYLSGGTSIVIALRA
jgi:hypothetical protein